MKSIKDQRNTDFINLCALRFKTLHAQGRNPTLEDVVDYVLMHPAPRYYADTSRVYTTVLKALNGGGLPECSELSREFFADFMRDLHEARQRYPGDSLRINLMRLTAGLFGRPRFYISRARAMLLAKLVFSAKVA